MKRVSKTVFPHPRVYFSWLLTPNFIWIQETVSELFTHFYQFIWLPEILLQINIKAGNVLCFFFPSQQEFCFCLFVVCFCRTSFQLALVMRRKNRIARGFVRSLACLNHEPLVEARRQALTSGLTPY